MRDFLAHYQLRDEQVAAVREGPIGDAFFAALEAVDRAQAKCRRVGEGMSCETGCRFSNVMQATMCMGTMWKS